MVPGMKAPVLLWQLPAQACWKEGDRVILNPLSGCGKCIYCRTGNYIYCPDKPDFYTHFAQYVKVQDFVYTPLPEDISYDVGAMACCALGPAFSSIKRMNLRAFDNILITVALARLGWGRLQLKNSWELGLLLLSPSPLGKRWLKNSELM